MNFVILAMALDCPPNNMLCPKPYFAGNESGDEKLSGSNEFTGDRKIVEVLFSEDDIKEALQRRGPDSLGAHTINLCSNIYHDELKYLTVQSFVQTERVVENGCKSELLGGATLKLRGVNPNFQLLTDEFGNVLVYNGEIYGGINIGRENNDTKILMQSLGQYCSCISPACSEENRKSIPQLLSRIRGAIGFDLLECNFAQYVTLNGNPEKNLFYYFVASEKKPDSDPVVLWLNGGPGCSSFDGFVYEHGPFNFEAAKQKGDLPILHLNPYSWSKVANIIYLDSPVGVGFSYSANTSHYANGGLQTAADTHLFLRKWFAEYSEYKDNPFYIAGESYAGVFIPTLASNVVKGIKTGHKPIINFKGYMVGNGVCDNEFDGNALVPFVHGMGLISDDMFKDAEVYCESNYHKNQNNKSCKNMLTKINKVIDGLNMYDILEPCFHRREKKDVTNENTTALPQSFKQQETTKRKQMSRAFIQSLSESVRKITVSCVDDVQATIWLNNDTVRKAIHASPECGEWSLCVKLNYTWDTGSMISYHKNLTSGGYRALIYSGDHDMVVPFTGTQAWIQSLGYQIVDEWRPWKSNGQVAGFLQEYANNLTFLTVKGAGHMVPQYKPRESLDFFSRWLAGQLI